MAGIKGDIIVVSNTIPDVMDVQIEKLKDTGTLMRILAVEVERQKDREFESSGHGTWQASKNPKGRTLRDTGRLKRSYTTRVSGNSVTLGSNYKIAAIHHFGGTIKHPGSQAKPGGVLAFTTRGGATVVCKRTQPHDITIPSRPLHGIPPGPPKRKQEMDRLLQMTTDYMTRGSN